MAFGAAVILAWVIACAVAAPFAGKLGGLQKNDVADFLPSTAEATQVLQLEARFQSARVVPAVIVFERTGGITPADRSAVAGRLAGADALEGVVGQPSPLVSSSDGEALEAIVNVDGSSITGTADTVAMLRSRLRGPDGLKVYVTGPAGLAADFGGAFKALDLKLLIGTTVVVVIVLLAVYRSPVLWAVPLAGVGAALVAAQALVYFTVRHFGLSSNGQSQGLLTVLVFGAGTDYALLLISRYREELRRHPTPATAVIAAVRGTAPAILASGTTVILALLCLLLSDLGSNKSLGPTAAIGIACAMVAMLTFLPAVLAVTGRRLFWPFAPKFGTSEQARPGLWTRTASLVGRRSRMMWIGSTLLLIAMAFGLARLNADGIAPTDQYTVPVESVTGQKAADRHFAGGAANSAVIVGSAAYAGDLLAAARAVAGVTDVAVLTTSPASSEPRVVAGRVLINVALDSEAGSDAARSTVRALRGAVHAIPGAGALVGGSTAVDLDTQQSSTRDVSLIIPVVLLVILVVLVLLLRSLVAPLVLVATVVLSFAATLGISGFVFASLFHFTGADPSFPLTAFVFLTALGVDYNIFLMTRVREEALSGGTRQGVVTGLSSTGTVITSAGIVLAATFSVFGVLPLVIFAEIGFAVAFGVLLDTLLVRTVLVPSLIHDLGRRAWWPARLAADDRGGSAVPVGGGTPATVDAA